jgi:hypothetical protein
MARSRTGVLLLVLAGLAVLSGTAATLLSRNGAGPKPSRVKRIADAPRAPQESGRRPEAPPFAPGHPSARIGSLWVRVVLHPEGTPVRGAEVFLQDRDGVWSAETDSEGDALFEVPRGTTVLLRARAQDLSGPTIVVDARGEQEVPFLLAVSRAGAVHGTVRTRATGAALAGAKVRVTENVLVPAPWQAFPAAAPELRGPEADALTDAAGRFRVEGLARESGCVVTATKEGFAREKVHAVPAEVERDPAGLEILLTAGTRVAGVARDRAGRPVEGVQVTLDPFGRPDRARDWPNARVIHFRSARDASGEGRLDDRTASDGAFAFDGIPEGRSVHLSAEKQGWVVLEGDGSVAVPEGVAEVRRDLVLDRVGDVTLGWTVAGGEAPAAATVDVRPLAEGDVPWTYLRFRKGGRIPDLRPGSYRFTVLSEEAGQGEAEVDVGGGVVAEVTVALGPGTGIEGEVVDPDGSPVPGAIVHLMTGGNPARHAGYGRRLAGNDSQGVAVFVPNTRPGNEEPMTLGANNFSRADAAGRFRFVGLRDGSAWGLLVSAPGYAPKSVDGVTVPATGLRIALDRTGTVTGRLLLPAGIAAPRTLSIYYRAGSTPTEQFWWGNLRATVGFGDGRFSACDLPPGRGTLVFRIGDPVCGGTVEVDVPSGGSVDAGDVPLAAGVAFRGRVVDAAGAPVPGAYVTLATMGSASGSATAGPDGSFLIYDVPEGRARLQATRARTQEGYATTAPGRGGHRVAAVDGAVRDFVVAAAWVDVAQDGPPVVLAFPPEGLLRGTVSLRAAGTPTRNPPYQGGFVRCVRAAAAAGDPGFSTRTDAQGRFAMCVPAGAYRIEVLPRSDGGDPVATGEADVIDGGEAVVEWREKR